MTDNLSVAQYRGDDLRSVIPGLWPEVLAKSSASRLFLCWDWIDSWWSALPKQADEQLVVLVARHGEAVLGLGAFVLGTARRLPGIRLTSMQCAGNRLNESRGMFSEYLGIVALQGSEAPVIRSIAAYAAEHLRAAEIVVPWTANAVDWVAACATIPSAFVRNIELGSSYQADISQGFTQYAQQLGSSTRRSLVNLRSRLAERGTVVVEQASPGMYRHYLDELSRLHSVRWGSPPFSTDVLRFHDQLFEKWREQKRIILSRIKVGDQYVSYLYDLRVDGCQYNLQMGFDPAFDAKLSLGRLHLGYAMEDAAESGVATYDFLAGKGQSTNYKQHLASRVMPMSTVQCISGRFYSPLFRAKDFCRDLLFGQ